MFCAQMFCTSSNDRRVCTKSLFVVPWRHGWPIRCGLGTVRTQTASLMGRVAMRPVGASKGHTGHSQKWPPPEFLVHGCFHLPLHLSFVQHVSGPVCTVRPGTALHFLAHENSLNHCAFFASAVVDVPTLACAFRHTFCLMDTCFRTDRKSVV